MAVLQHHPIPGALYREGGGPGGGTHRFGQNWQSSWAQDLMAPAGSIVVAVFDGVITRSGELGSSGRFAGVRIGLQGARHAAYYAHLSESFVRVGQRVKAGDEIGRSGSAVGVDHLHFALTEGLYDNSDEKRGLDPVPLLRALATKEGSMLRANQVKQAHERPPLAQVIADATPLSLASAQQVVDRLGDFGPPPHNADEILMGLMAAKPRLGIGSIVGILWTYMKMKEGSDA